jgi:hypothetical protein
MSLTAMTPSEPKSYPTFLRVRTRRSGAGGRDRDAPIYREGMKVPTPEAHLHRDSDAPTRDRCPGIDGRMKILAEQRSDEDF